jgi:predicted O-linked N-acetylglucosamine transferase (SPINDLY family)
VVADQNRPPAARKLPESACEEGLSIGFAHRGSPEIGDLFSAHDHHNCEIFCYADGSRPDGITARLRCCADAWRDIASLTDLQVARLVRQDRIDILIDPDGCAAVCSGRRSGLP